MCSSPIPARKRPIPRSRLRSPTTMRGRQGSRTAPDRPRTRLSRRRIRRHFGRRHCRQPQILRHRCWPASITCPTPIIASSRPSPSGEPAWGGHLADELENLVALHDASTIAAVIVEPMAGSTGVLPPRKGYLKRLRADMRQARHPADFRRGHHRFRSTRLCLCGRNVTVSFRT